MAANALYASLFEEGVRELRLSELSESHRSDGAADYLNVLRYLDLPAAVAMASELVPVQIYGVDAADWQFPAAVARQCAWAGRFQILDE